MVAGLADPFTDGERSLLARDFSLLVRLRSLMAKVEPLDLRLLIREASGVEVSAETSVCVDISE